MTEHLLLPWSSLSDDAQRVLEYVEDPHTGRRNDIFLSVGEKVRLSDKLSQQHASITKLVVCQDLFDEIHRFISQDDGDEEVHVEVSEDRRSLVVKSSMPDMSLFCGSIGRKP